MTVTAICAFVTFVLGDKEVAETPFIMFCSTISAIELCA